MRSGRRLVLASLLVAASGAALVAGCGESSQPTSSSTGRERLLEGGTEAFKRELARLSERPVVVNQWASWCPPCREEFPFFQRLARRHRGKVAFLGVNAQDNRGDAREFLRRYPTPFPHFFDPDAKIARMFRGGIAWPTTAFYAAGGRLSFTHQGAYRSEGDLDRDIKRYALGG